jgi:hypothetical protein
MLKQNDFQILSIGGKGGRATIKEILAVGW